MTIVKGLGLSRFRGALLLLVDALRLAFTGTSLVARVFLAQQLTIQSLRERLDKFEQEER